MTQVAHELRVLEGVTPDQIPFDDLLRTNQPTILRGLVSDWELVKVGKESTENAMALLEEHSTGRPVGVYIAPPESKGRFFYNDECTGFNYEQKLVELGEILAQTRDNSDNPQHPYCYMNSLTLDDYFPGLREHLPVEITAHDLVAGHRQHLGDARPHHTCTHHTDSFHGSPVRLLAARWAESGPAAPCATSGIRLDGRTPTRVAI